jgi:hypothetical protein
MPNFLGKFSKNMPYFDWKIFPRVLLRGINGRNTHAFTDFFCSMH